jgi:hypothetical protein
MDKFVARENIRHFRDRLETETDASQRSLLQRLLIEEEDKLGHNLETLSMIETHITHGRTRVYRQRSLIVSMEQDGHDTAQARALLGALNETLLIFEYRRQAILNTVDQSSL